jgi:hypothetical protein
MLDMLMLASKLLYVSTELSGVALVIVGCGWKA